ncbi:hypothetical protein [Hyphococcus sp.]|uniref:hypothetical protein n=1 Tax=Hyphococcus sp. TaxID=2038636 RepID=UPI002087CF27|nr:MAG: hypothetical protein DHS20C04_10240 [Marinicaulis sp.]
MPSVKQSRKRLILAPAALAFVALQGCESTDLARFAPPGIIKYEDRAGDQPANPEIVARVAERKADPEAGGFPNLSAAPGKEDRPQKREQDDIEAEITGLTEARDEVVDAAEMDRLAAEAELARDLPAERDALKAQIEKDEAIAARERREKLQAPESEN